MSRRPVARGTTKWVELLNSGPFRDVTLFVMNVPNLPEPRGEYNDEGELLRQIVINAETSTTLYGETYCYGFLFEIYFYIEI